MLQIKRESQITFLRSEALDRIPGFVHAFATRRSDRNDFTLGPASNPLVQMNRDRFLAAIGATGWPLMKLMQVHSGTVLPMEDTSAAGEPIQGDAAVTALQGIALGIQTADCLPILIADNRARAVAAIHAGWRGTAVRIAQNAITRLRENFGIDPKDLTAAIGPHIGVCCYEVGPDVLESFTDSSVFEQRAGWAKAHLNLAEANRRQLMESGVPEEQIEISSLCTKCRGDLFYSYRRDGTKAGRMLSVIGIAP